ncbi:MAG: protein translocase subunit SecD [Planctomycetes bacterium]|nr:protein translocase subunit SecD [Planctomycetota bacterium]
MSKSYVPVLGAGLLAGLLSCAIFGALTYTAFNIWRQATILQDTYDSAKKEGGDALDRFILKGEPAVQLQNIYRPITESAAIDAYKKAKTGKTSDLDAFFESTVLPSTKIAWACLIFIVVAWFLLLKMLRGLFGEFTGKMVLTFGLMGILGGYFWLLAGNNIYPMGIDLAGGTELVYRLEYRDVQRRIDDAQKRLSYLEANKDKTDDQTKKVIDEDMLNRQRSNLRALRDSMATAPEKATEVVRKRVDPTGTKGVPITRFGEDRIRIQLPKASPEDVERIKRAIRTQGRLTFHAVSEDADIKEKVQKNPNKEWGEFVSKEIDEADPYDPNGKRKKKEDVVMNRTPEMEGSGIVAAYSTRSEQGGYKIQLTFDSAAAARFEEVTKRNLHKRLAIVLDGKCQLAPTIQSVISDQCQITGSFTKQQADEDAAVLTAGSLPAEVEMESEFVVGPSLGQEQIQSGIFATAIGALAVALFMWTYYRLAGFISIVNLFVLLSVMLGALGFFKATMTLPGIAGILLNLGMAVDANVLIYERFREELARGRNLRQAVNMGFDRAFVVILDSQLTTLICGIILYYLGSGPVRGFAVTLSIGVLVTLFSNVWVCHQIFLWLVSKDVVESLHMMQFFKVTSIDFMGKRKLWMGVSAVAIAASIAGFIYLGPVKEKIYDVDFTGGTLVQFNFSPKLEPSDEEVKAAVADKLKPQLRARLADMVLKLDELAAGGKTGPNLKKALAAALPEVDRAEFGTLAEIAPAQLQDLSKDLKKVLEDYNGSEFTVQSFGQASESGPDKYRSFTLTTRFTDHSVVEALDEELHKTFAGRIEPPAVEAAEGGLRLRISPSAKAPDTAVTAAVKGTIESLAAKIENEDIRTELAALKVSEVKQEPYGSGLTRPYLLISPLPADPLKRDKLLETLATNKFAYVPPGEKDINLRAEGPVSRKSSFGPQVASEMFLSSILAVLAALLAIFAYVWFRFEFSPAWGFGALVATLHDPTLCIGAACLVTVLSPSPVLLNLDIIAAILTVIGYSVNDTIVVFDRIREVKTAHPTRDLGEIINEAVNATLSRTVLTSTTALITMLALLVFGGPTIRNLAFTLTIGIIVGTYSSIFIASPLMLWWVRTYGAGKAAAPAKVKEEKPGSEPDAHGAQI